MANSAGYHESEEKLRPETQDNHRALTSMQEELEAADWYDQRVDAATDPELKEKAPFRFSAQTRVGFSDTDAQGIVYYGRYLPYFDDARVEYLRHLALLDAPPSLSRPSRGHVRAL